MNKATNAHLYARKLLSDNGLDEITDISMDLFVSGIGATFIEEPLNLCDGKIIFGEKKTIIKVNSEIRFTQRKRFIAAHEVGHFIMHKDMKLPPETFKSINIIAGLEKTLKSGKQELEANEFASELLMPETVFLNEAKGKPFTPLLIKELAERFKTSLTSVVFKYIQLNLHPVCCVFISNGRVKYWKKSKDLNVWVEDYNKLPPPGGSVASEYIEENYAYLYKLEEKAQTINKSTWFKLRDNDEDSEFYEYCIPTKQYKSILSIIWED